METALHLSHITQVAELDDRSQAEQLLDYTIHIPLADRETLRDPDEFWVQDLVGCTVVLKVRLAGTYHGCAV